jgi:hypothetical protein
MLFNLIKTLGKQVGGDIISEMAVFIFKSNPHFLPKKRNVSIIVIFGL